MKIYFLHLISTLFVLCSYTEYSHHINKLSTKPPEVKSKPTYKVHIEKDVVYANGLVHDSINSTNNTILPLKLDVYSPENTNTNRPLYMFIHGGGFSGGSKTQDRVVNLANYYTSRGWVFVSVDYRLKKHKGTVPQEWVDFSNNVPNSSRAQFLAIYPAQRDAKAALRWLVANAKTYHINTNYITVGGASAGAMTAIALGVSNVKDFRDELSLSQDPTLTSTNLNETYHIKTIINLWGSKVALDGLQDSFNTKNRFNKDNPPLFTAHGTLDPIVPYQNAKDLKDIYNKNDVAHILYPLENRKHGVWNATVNGKKLEDLAFDFIVKQQSLEVN